MQESETNTDSQKAENGALDVIANFFKSKDKKEPDLVKKHSIKLSDDSEPIEFDAANPEALADVKAEMQRLREENKSLKENQDKFKKEIETKEKTKEKNALESQTKKQFLDNFYRKFPDMNSQNNATREIRENIFVNIATNVAKNKNFSEEKDDEKASRTYLQSNIR